MRERRGWFELLVIVAAALALRLYRIADYTTFQGDQGVDALAAKRLLVDHIIPLEGPATSAGGVHLGPFYYYLLALPMSVVWLEPLADAVFMAILGALSAGLSYVVAKEWFGRAAGLAAGGLMTISPAAITDARSAWNPAPAPFFVLLALYGLARYGRTCDGRWLILTSGALACVIQFHYFSLGLILVVFGAQVWLVARGHTNLRWFVIGLAVAALIVLPLILHEVRDGYPNLRAAVGLVNSSAEATQAGSLPRRLYAVLVPSLVAPFLAADLEPLAIVLTAGLLIGLTVVLVKGPASRFGAGLLAAGFAVMLAQAALYRGPIFPHYLIAYSPLLFLAVGAAVAPLHRWSAVVVVLLAGISFSHLPFGDPERQLMRSEDVASHIAAASGSEPFAIWLLATDDSDGAYRFQLERIGHPAVSPSEAQPEHLFAICQFGTCTDSQVREAIGQDWSNSQISTRASIDGVEVIELLG